MERHFCVNCYLVGTLTTRGECETCGSKAVVSEHAQNLEVGLTAWLDEAEQTLQRIERTRLSYGDQKFLKLVGIRG